MTLCWDSTLQWHHNECGGISNNQPHYCLLNHLFRCRSKKTSKRCVTGLCKGNSLVTSKFFAQRASNAENVSVWWRHHDINVTFETVAKYSLDNVSKQQTAYIICINDKNLYFILCTGNRLSLIQCSVRRVSLRVGCVHLPYIWHVYTHLGWQIPVLSGHISL